MTTRVQESMLYNILRPKVMKAPQYGRLLIYQQTLGQAGKASQGLNTLAYYENSELTAAKSFYNIGPSLIKHYGFVMYRKWLDTSKLLSFDIASHLSLAWTNTLAYTKSENYGYMCYSAGQFKHRCTNYPKNSSKSPQEYTSINFQGITLSFFVSGANSIQVLYFRMRIGARSLQLEWSSKQDSTQAGSCLAQKY